jgi:hypothetical protein
VLQEAEGELDTQLKELLDRWDLLLLLLFLLIFHLLLPLQARRGGGRQAGR